MFSSFVPYLISASQQSQGFRQSRWSYPHLIDVETMTQWGVLANGTGLREDRGFLAECGASSRPTAPMGPNGIL